jgi:hypothetical protein
MTIGRSDVHASVLNLLQILHVVHIPRAAAFENLREESGALRRRMHHDEDGRRQSRWQRGEQLENRLQAAG